MPICMGPAAPKPFCPECTPGKLDWPSLDSHFADPGEQNPGHPVTAARSS
jgi:hypothetical protein